MEIEKIEKGNIDTNKTNSILATKEDLELGYEFPGSLEQAILNYAEKCELNKDSKISFELGEREDISPEAENLFEQIEMAQKEIKNGSASKEEFQQMHERLLNDKNYQYLPEKIKKEITRLEFLFTK
ncbi:MAG: hypothetical protein WCX88_01885 [Patescibacteria group bacterium]